MTLEEIYLTEKEQQIIDSINPPQREALQRLNVTCLSKYKFKIVGVRCEDLFFFLDCLNKGKMPVGGYRKGYRYKCKEGLYLTPNLECLRLREIENEEVKTVIRLTGNFSKATTANVGVYSDVALLGPLHREVRPLIIGEPELMDESVGHPRDPLQVEQFYYALVQEIAEGAEFGYKNRFPRHYALGQHLRPQDRDFITQLFNRIKCRSGIIIGFNEQLIERYGFPAAGDGDDIMFSVPNGYVDLDTILGFETLGDYEEEVVEDILKR